MTNVRSSGFDSPAQFREHMADLDEQLQEAQASSDPNARVQVQIDVLRNDVREMRRLIVETRNKQRQIAQKRPDDRFWLRLAATVAATFALTAAVRYLRLGPAGAAAVPLIASRINGAL